MSVNLDECKKKMDSALEAVKREFVGLRTGRASPNLLDHIKVDAYGAETPINQVGAVSVPEPRLLTVSVWDASLVKAVEKAIRESDLGLNPMTEGNTIRVPLPSLTEERRKELVKVAGKYAESGRIAVRNVRRDFMDAAKAAEKKNEITEDEQKKLADKIQKLTDDHVKLVDDLLSAKEKEITQV
jgi:ribosome recycling factor